MVIYRSPTNTIINNIFQQSHGRPSVSLFSSASSPPSSPLRSTSNSINPIKAKLDFAFTYTHCSHIPYYIILLYYYTTSPLINDTLASPITCPPVPAQSTRSLSRYRLPPDDSTRLDSAPSDHVARTRSSLLRVPCVDKVEQCPPPPPPPPPS